MQLNPKATKVRIRAELNAVHQLRENLQKAIVALDKKRLKLQSAYKALQDVEAADDSVEEIARVSGALQSSIEWNGEDPPFDSLFGAALVRPEQPEAAEHLLPEQFKSYR